jgi:hypothetical protein
VCATAANSIGFIVAFLCCEFCPVLVIFSSAERSLLMLMGNVQTGAAFQACILVCYA